MQQTETMDILIIGAAPLPQGTDVRDRERLRHFQSVQNDIRQIFELCQNRNFVYERSRLGVRSSVNVVKTLINSKELMPPAPPSGEQLLDTSYKPAVYTSKGEVRRDVTKFLAETASDVVMIYYSGHGSYHATKGPSDKKEQALLLPVSHSRSRGEPELVAYTNTDLTEDIDRHLAEDKKLFLVIDANHAENSLNLWELRPQIRLDRVPVVLLAGANREINADVYDDRLFGGMFTYAFVNQAPKHVGKPLWQLEQAILEELPFQPDANAAKARSSACKYSFPVLCKEPFLPKSSAVAAF